MKQCPQCRRTYSDEDLKFCLEDGAPLVADASLDGETIAGSASDPSPTPRSNAIRISPFESQSATANQTFSAPASQAASNAPPPAKTNWLPLAFLGAGAAALLLAGVAAAAYFLFGLNPAATARDSAAVPSPTAAQPNSNGSANTRESISPGAANIKQQQDALEKERERIAAERKKLEAQKLEAQKRNSDSPTDNIETKSPAIALPAPGGGNWFVILGTFDKEDARLGERLEDLRRRGYNPTVIDTGDYPNFAPGMDAVVFGPYSKTTATRVASQMKSVRPDAYAKSGY